MITNFKLFIEPTFAGISLKDIDYDVTYNKKDFVIDTELLSELYLPKYDKTINIKWYDTNIHDIKERIDKRTHVESISEFNNILIENLRKFFNKYLNEILLKMSNYKFNRIAVGIDDLLAYIIISYNPDELYNDDAEIRILSIVPKVTKPIKINRTFYI